jgi:hypothetical protein
VGQSADSLVTFHFRTITLIDDWGARVLSVCLHDVAIEGSAIALIKSAFMDASPLRTPSSKGDDGLCFCDRKRLVCAAFGSRAQSGRFKSVSAVFAASRSGTVYWHSYRSRQRAPCGIKARAPSQLPQNRGRNSYRQTRCF